MFDNLPFDTYIYIYFLIIILIYAILSIQNTYIKFGIILVIIFILLYLIWSSYKSEEVEEVKDVKENNDNKIEPVVDDTDENINVEKPNYDLKLQHKDFSLDKNISEKPKQITYKQFKDLYKSHDFISKYTNAIKKALNLKRKRISEVLNEYIKQKNTLESKGKKQQNIISKIVDLNEEITMINTTIDELKYLITKVNEKIKNITEAEVYRNLDNAINNPNNGIDSLIGREEIKDFLALQIYTFAQNPRVFFTNFQNILIYGDSGIGKTKLAKVIGYVYSHCGILLKDNVYITTKRSFTTPFVNESARKTLKILLSNLESVIFIDEAYDLVNQNIYYSDHGIEAVTEMINFMDKMIGLSIIICAGYEDLMKERFLSSNQGLARRFPHVLTLKKYNSKELTLILIDFMHKKYPDIIINENICNYLYTIINCVNKKNEKVFDKQAGSIENLSADIAKSIYATPGKTWPQDYEYLINNGINMYLSHYNLSLKNNLSINVK
ncbi:MAG: AAA family ATPase [Candidatus Micrarchaeaceae archaeon]